jgi:hypothetical protein
MKKKKLKLEHFKVQSFVTSFDKNQNQTLDVKGGNTVNRCLPPTYQIWCMFGNK